MPSFITEFIYCSLLMGLGIGIDAAIATGLRARDMSAQRSAMRWIIGVSLTHTLFPMLGYASTYLGLSRRPELSPFIGFIAFALIAHFLVGEIKQRYQADQHHQEHSSVLISVGLMLAVSWDALWSGPAKSAQVIGWPDSAIWASFIVVGFTVTLLTSMALVLSTLLQGIQLPVAKRVFRATAQWLQLGVIGYFGLLALCRYCFNSNIASIYLLLMALLFIAIAMLIPGRIVAYYSPAVSNNNR